MAKSTTTRKQNAQQQQPPSDEAQSRRYQELVADLASVLSDNEMIETIQQAGESGDPCAFLAARWEHARAHQNSLPPRVHASVESPEEMLARHGWKIVPKTVRALNMVKRDFETTVLGYVIEKESAAPDRFMGRTLTWTLLKYTIPFASKAAALNGAAIYVQATENAEVVKTSLRARDLQHVETVAVELAICKSPVDEPQYAPKNVTLHLNEPERAVVRRLVMAAEDSGQVLDGKPVNSVQRLFLRMLVIASEGPGSDRLKKPERATPLA